MTVSATLKSCSLINIKTLKETKLDGNDSFTLDKANDKGYSIRCDISSVGRLSKIKFSYDGRGHVETNSPYFMFGDEAAGKIINPVKYLSTCGLKMVKVQGFLHDDLSFEETFNIKVKNPSGVSCDSGNPPVPSPTRAPVSEPVPATLKSCSLINIKTLKETKLDGNDSFTLDKANDKGYSIRCDTSSVGKLSKIKFSYDGRGHVEFNSPYYMFGGKAAGSIINPVKYLSTCGLKVVKVQGFLRDELSFEETFSIKVKNPSGVSCDSGNPPVPSPTRAPKGVPAPVPVSGSCPAQVTGYTLVDAKRNTDIMPLRSYSMSDVPELLNIRVDIRQCSPRVVESVLIDFDGKTLCENFAPYAVFGDDSKKDIASSKANYNGKAISAGRHVIKATPYTKDKCQGTAGNTHTLEFNVEEEIPYV